MSEHTITISESTYQSLISEIQATGMTIDSWIASKLSSSDMSVAQIEEAQFSFVFPEDLVGSIDSSAEPQHPDEVPPVLEKDSFAQAIIAKMAKQGIRLP